MAAPVIGLVVGHWLQPVFERVAPARRKFVALASLYLGSTCFGLAIGVGSMLGLTPGTRRFPAALVEPVLASWWGVTLTGFFLMLWPLAYLTHWCIEWRAGARR